MTLRFLHAADIHLDSPMLNLDRYEGAPVEEFRSATRKAMDNLVQLAIEEQVDLVLIAGDLYDGECKDMNTALELRRSLEELSAADIGVFIVQGNHDAQSRVTKGFRLEMPKNVHLFKTSKAQTIHLKDLGVAIHGQGFSEQSVAENLSSTYPEPVSGAFNIGLLHTNCGGAPGHDDYAPSTVDGLRAKGYDYWALGHIHKRQELHQGDPWIVYPGNLQGRSVRETGAKGCTLVEVAGGRVTSVEHRALDVARWEICEVDTSACDGGQAVVNAVMQKLDEELMLADGRSLAARVVLKGASVAHADLSTHREHWNTEIRNAAVDRFDERVWVEKIQHHTETSVDLDAIANRDDALGDLLRNLSEPEAVSAAIGSLRVELKKMLDVLPTDPRLPSDILDFEDPKAVQELLNEVTQLLIPRLLGAGGER